MKHVFLQYRAGENALTRTLYDRCHKYNNDSRIAFIGDTGGSKSYSAITLAKALDKTFTADRIVFTAEQFSNYVKDHDLKRGQAVIFDEAGIKYSNRKWWTEENIKINELLQTLRYRGLILIFTAPSIREIDVGGRSKFHVYFETKRIDFGRKLGVFRPFIIQVNPRSGKRYEKFPIYYRVWVKNNANKRRVKRQMAFTLPPPDLMKDYEAAAKKFKDTVGRILQQKNAQDKTTIQDIVAEIMKNPEPYKVPAKRGTRKIWNVLKVVEDFGISIYRAKEILKTIN